MRRRRAEEFELEPIYMVAMMKVQHDLKKVSSERFERLLATSLCELGIDRESFLDYIESNRESLEKTAETVGI